MKVRYLEQDGGVRLTFAATETFHEQETIIHMDWLMMDALEAWFKENTVDPFGVKCGPHAQSR